MNIPKLDLTVLPEKLRNNWHIYIALRSYAEVAYARSVADSQVGDGRSAGDTADTPNWEWKRKWCNAFDAAALDWYKVNPMDPMWATGRWPEGADEYLGNKALEEARTLISS